MADWSILDINDLLEFSHTTIFRVYIGQYEKVKILIEWKFPSQKFFVDARQEYFMKYWSIGIFPYNYL